MRRKSETVTARQNAKAEDRTAALQQRITALSAIAPNADPADIKYLAIHCATLPTWPTLWRVITSR